MTLVFTNKLSKPKPVIVDLATECDLQFKTIEFSNKHNLNINEQNYREKILVVH